MSRRDNVIILVSGMMAGDPDQGGATWAVLQYILGFQKLGHTVYFVEPLNQNAIPPGGSLAGSRSAAYFRNVVAEFGLLDNSALLLQGTFETVGLSYQKLREVVKDVDILVNISGMLEDENLVSPIPKRIYVDLDPAFNQLWHATQGIDMRFKGHNRFVTVGQAIGTSECSVPVCGIEWKAIFPPVVLERFSGDREIHHDAFTTIANWRAYGSIEYDGVLYGQKAHSVRTFMDLPLKSPNTFTLALSIDSAEKKDLQALSMGGWKLLDPVAVAGTPGKYRAFVEGSRAEIGIAKSGYVVSRCGWFSDRSACYMACARPVVCQDTGIRRSLPVGCGLFSFSNADEAIAGIDAINSNYAFHSRAAREIASEYFNSSRVLAKLVELSAVA
jgi:hypothetical protein